MPILPHLSLSAPTQSHPARGFTAIELLVTIAILAVLATLAAPSFTPSLERWRVMQATEQLKSTLYFARSEAIKQGGDIVIQKLTNAQSQGCTLAPGSNDWGCGWIVCHDSNGNGTCNTGEPVLQRTDINLEITRRAGGAKIKINRWGLVEGTYVGFALITPGKNMSDPNSKGVCLSSGGRIRVIPSTELPCNS